MVSCETFRIGFFRLAFQFFGIALSKPKYVVKGTFKLNVIASSCHFKNPDFDLINHLSW